jgi:hypothetical protein
MRAARRCCRMRKSSVVLVAFVSTTVIAVLLAAPARAAATRVTGLQIPDLENACPETSIGTFTMEGGLIGCWYTDEFSAVREHPSGTVQITGTEHFVGCLDHGLDGSCVGDLAGTLTFSFQFSGMYDLVTFAEIRGRCEHLIVSGTGGFANAGGVITFKDDVSTGIASYSGAVRI